MQMFQRQLEHTLTETGFINRYGTFFDSDIFKLFSISDRTEDGSRCSAQIAPSPLWPVLPIIKAVAHY